jgi:hypothetical protein
MRSRKNSPLPDQCTELHGNEPESSPRATVCATVSRVVAPEGLPADLQSIVDAWDDIPAALRTGIVAMVLAARSNGG